MTHPMPQDGGSYRRNSDGSLTQITPATCERACTCRKEPPPVPVPLAPPARAPRGGKPATPAPTNTPTTDEE